MHHDSLPESYKQNADFELEEMQHAQGQFNTRMRSNTGSTLMHFIQVQVLGTTGVRASGDVTATVSWNDEALGSPTAVAPIIDWNPLASSDAQMKMAGDTSACTTYEVPLPHDMLSVSYSLHFEVRAAWTALALTTRPL